MADFDSKWIEIFRAGDYGDKGKWTPEMLDQVVANFHSVAVVEGKPRRPHTPPAVLGHPANDAPAYGWVSDLEREGDTLKARFSKVQPALEAMVKDGRFPNRSAAFYLDPQGKGPVLRHVGFLGAAPPEVKGLEPIHFSDGDFVAIDFKEEEMSEKKTDATPAQPSRLEQFMEHLRSFFGGEAGDPAKPKVFTEADVNAAIDKAKKDIEAKFAEQQKKVGAALAASKLTAFAERLTGKKVAPAIAGAARAFAEALLEGKATVTFGEGDKKLELALFDAFCSFVETNAATVPTSEVAGSQGTGFADLPEINATRGKEVVGVEHLRQVKGLQTDSKKAGKELSFTEASELVSAKNGGTAQAPGSSSAGAV